MLYLCSVGFCDEVLVMLVKDVTCNLLSFKEVKEELTPWISEGVSLYAFLNEFKPALCIVSYSTECDWLTNDYQPFPCSCDSSVE